MCRLLTNVMAAPAISVTILDPRGCSTYHSPPGRSYRVARGPPVAPTAVQHSVPVILSVVMVDETPGRSNRNLPSPPDNGICRLLSGAVPPADVPATICSVVLPTIAGAAPLAEVAEVVAVSGRPCWGGGGITIGVAPLAVADPTTMVAGLADARILFPANPVGTLSPSDPAGILFPADPVGMLSHLTLLEYCFQIILLGRCPRLTLLEYCSRPMLLGRCPHLTLLGYCSRPTLLGYCSRPTLLGRAPLMWLTRPMLEY